MKTKILIVDGDPVFGKSIAAKIEKLGYKVPAIISKIEKSYPYLEENKVDIILIDTAKRIPAKLFKNLIFVWSHFKLPIILLANSSNKKFLKLDKYPQLFTLLIKPYNQRELKIAIEQTLSKVILLKRTTNLNSLINLERKVIQIINKADNSNKLIRDVCRSLILKTNFQAAFITLLDHSGNLVYSAQAGLKNINILNGSIKDNKPTAWVNKVLLKDDIVEIDNLKNIKQPFLKNNQKSLNIRLNSIENTLGLISVIFRKRRVSAVEKLTFKNIASYLEYSIYNIDIKNKDIEETLAQSEAKFRMVIEKATDIIFTANQNGNFTYVNNAGLLNTGYSEDELLKSNYLDLILPEYKETVRSFYKKQFESKQTSAYIEYPFRTKTGEIKWYGQNSTLILDNNIFKGFHCISRDISERKQFEEEINKRQREITTLVDNLPGLVFLKDINGCYIVANQKFCNAMGVTQHKLIGKTDFDFLPKEQAELYQSDDLKVIESGEMQYVLKEKVLIDNKYLTIGTRKVPLKDENGIVFGLIGLGFDITEHKEAEEAIKKYTKELEQLNANKDKLFSIISHDLRSPFQGLLGLSNALVNEYDNLSQNEIQMFLDNINNAAKNLYNLIENLLQWSRVQRSNIKMNLIKIELHDEIEYIVGLIQNNATKKNIQIINETSSGIFVNSDANILNSTLQNLISNAIKFTNHNGLVTISAVKKGKVVDLTVKDNGVGIPKENLEKLFRIDTRHSTPGTEMEPGTGLGLIICKELIEIQGGTISVKSIPGMGTEFTVTLQQNM